MRIKRFEGIEAWQLAWDLARKLYGLTKNTNERKVTRIGCLRPRATRLELVDKSRAEWSSSQAER